jgi:ribonucleoside-diphosphate reductase alpha chain
MSARRRLPNRRGSVTFALEAGGLRFTCTASWFDDGSLGEVFLQNHKADSTAGIMASDSAIAASLALQYGCPPEVLQKALSRDARGDPTGPLGIVLDTLYRKQPPAAGAPAPAPSPPPPGAPGAAAAEPVS